MDDAKLRKLALDVFANSNTETLLDALQNMPKNRLATAELDAFNRYLEDSLKSESEKLAEANDDYQTSIDYARDNTIQRRPSNIGASLARLNEIDVMKNPSKTEVTVVKKEQPFIVPRGTDSRTLPIQFAKESTTPSELLQSLLGGGKGIDAKEPKLDDQIETNFPMGWLSASGSALEQQENHSDDEAVW